MTALGPVRAPAAATGSYLLQCEAFELLAEIDLAIDNYRRAPDGTYRRLADVLAELYPKPPPSRSLL